MITENPEMIHKALIATLANELHTPAADIEAAVSLLDEGATVPFIARYRKEQTGAMTDTTLRQLEERLGYLRRLHERKQAILKSIHEQGKLTPELENSILAATNLTEAEDLYLPYKPKRRTKAQIAKEAGLLPLAEQLLAQPDAALETLAEPFINAELGFADTKAVLDGARQIIIEQWSETAELLAKLRDLLQQQGTITSQVVKQKQEEGKKFTDYFDFSEPFKQIRPHRALALFRGRREGILQLDLDIPQPDESIRHPAEVFIAQYAGIESNNRPADAWLQETVRWAWKTKLHQQLTLVLFNDLREHAEKQAIHVFANNLRDLLLAAPAGMRVVMGMDPGIRTGVKIAIVDHTGKLLAHTTIYPHPPKKQWKESLDTLAKLAKKHAVDLVSIGNGTASRETEQLVTELMQQHPELNLTKVIVSEAGASVYSASELATKEFPSLDVTIRGAVSIARRLQDPLAELVKIEPKAIGVGQYQHDVNQSELSTSLTHVVEDCVNAVGVDLNTASAELLSYISGLNQSIAEHIVAYRDEHGVFRSRQELLKVNRLGAKAFEQAAGFLKIVNGENPLDASAVHPESYPIVTKICKHLQQEMKDLIGSQELLRSLDPTLFIDDHVGLPTIKDIIRELEKPGRDPRPHFRTAQFKEGVNTLADLTPGMILEGTVSNLTDFGAFVDIGVHQDGLVHVSQLANRFVKDIRSVVKVGDIVKVKVTEVDIPRKRIGLSMRLEEKVDKKPVVNDSTKADRPKHTGKPEAKSGKSGHGKDQQQKRPEKAKPKVIENPVLGDALMAALGKFKSAE